MPFRQKRFQIETHKNKTLISGNPNVLKLLFVNSIIIIILIRDFNFEIQISRHCHISSFKNISDVTSVYFYPDLF